MGNSLLIFFRSKNETLKTWKGISKRAISHSQKLITHEGNLFVVRLNKFHVFLGNSRFLSNLHVPPTLVLYP